MTVCCLAQRKGCDEVIFTIFLTTVFTINYSLYNLTCPVRDVNVLESYVNFRVAERKTRSEITSTLELRNCEYQYV